ncbi:MAG: tRNA cyclic N6-threonylcarbamoyladenosine(37) synthase TcdA [Gammaproteobacteria bacterium]|nr:MAG: tRNA cyclic N6-threonylcarbamoyladenosine(37) synthase TcdA [Gammaproteobacteria bacterium]RTZ75598.1 MAG: tRNA cyclic N6-threonylcarbamoyladenosine(37) synthase TcdA [Gammaproteobacteria bacterium]RTZ80886.1 MAG: tRNA cyclic N6-threonylcarbamoyladenosine(37) synthase TcdA [Gammaproteobacteria bacterium]
MDFLRRFGGIARLYGPEALGRFPRAHVCIIGIGGVGSWTVEALARSAIGKLTLIDMDHLAESNINRQLPALEETLGRSKIGVMAERARAINPGVELFLVDDFLTRENLVELVRKEFDYVVDCIDSFRTKAALIHHCRRNRIRLVTVGGAGGQIDPQRIRVTDLSRTQQDPLLARTRRLLRQEYGFPRNPRRRFQVSAVWSDEPLMQHALPGESCEGRPTGGLNCGGYGSCTPVTAGFGMAAAAHVLRKLARTTSSNGVNC